jgi:hypothetical protein
MSADCSSVIKCTTSPLNGLLSVPSAQVSTAGLFEPGAHLIRHQTATSRYGYLMWRTNAISTVVEVLDTSASLGQYERPRGFHLPKSGTRPIHRLRGARRIHSARRPRSRTHCVGTQRHTGPRADFEGHRIADDSGAGPDGKCLRPSREAAGRSVGAGIPPPVHALRNAAQNRENRNDQRQGGAGCSG